MQESFIQKLYYGKFTHKAVIKCRNHRGKVTQPTGEVVEWLMAKKFKKDEWKGLHTWERTGYRYTVYFKGEDVLKFLIDQITEEFIVSTEKPMSTEHLKVLETEKVVTRRKLFYDKYRFAVRVSPKRQAGVWKSEAVQEMCEWCQENFGAAGDRYTMTYHSNASFFFRDANDVMLFKLSHHDIKTTERVMLFSEIPTEQPQKEISEAA